MSETYKAPERKPYDYHDAVIRQDFTRRIREALVSLGVSDYYAARTSCLYAGPTWVEFVVYPKPNVKPITCSEDRPNRDTLPDFHMAALKLLVQI